MPRLFAALEVPQDAARYLTLVQGGLHGARWIDPENYHITLRFFGDVEGHVADQIVETLDQVRRTAFDLELDGIHAFGSKKPHSIYAGVWPSVPLNELAADIDRRAKRLGLPSDKRKFTPHVTLARLRNPDSREVARWLAGRGGFRTLPFPVSRFVLMSSRDSVGGGPYVVEESWTLMREPDGGRTQTVRETADLV
ncbi:RNA 2',3'-cyclic phosphodiesterase [Notoacmeibacter sp. MSK16QG-6]|uniref:RNA 2',3'-cyclic phosphodiesterase n=1 Tax=Notoacmeibacter sp. MSK16QG-6 TaxID=2957982 RepID=UPI0020A180AF|nr:RNA 2',3'-cyclic phosphodiesterase [Notoacmeibacter sp. MSK16QG-6]MCP1199162.1 RNA 2',3'-cyclic phosphodiesterase [Notoacmeibacter sp. MSK16QG-6]